MRSRTRTRASSRSVCAAYCAAFSAVSFESRVSCFSLNFRWRLYMSPPMPRRSEENTSELQSLMRISYAVFCLKKKKKLEYTDKNTTLHLNNKATKPSNKNINNHLCRQHDRHI